MALYTRTRGLPAKRFTPKGLTFLSGEQFNIINKDNSNLYASVLSDSLNGCVIPGAKSQIDCVKTGHVDRVRDALVKGGAHYTKSNLNLNRKKSPLIPTTQNLLPLFDDQSSAVA